MPLDEQERRRLETLERWRRRAQNVAAAVAAFKPSTADGAALKALLEKITVASFEEERGR